MKKLLKVYLTVTKYVLQKKTGKNHSIILMNLYKKNVISIQKSWIHVYKIYAGYWRPYCDWKIEKQ